MLKHYVHCHQAYDLNKGGSVGYVSTLYASYLRYGCLETDSNIAINFLFPNIEKTERLKNWALKSIIDQRFENVVRFSNPDGLQNLINERKRWFREIIPASEYQKIDLLNISSIHIHGAYNFLPVYNYLKARGIENNVVKILTTHNPYKPEFEDMELISRGRVWKDADKRTLQYFFNERDVWAYRLADAIMFPSEFSMEGYFKTWPEFENIIKSKKIYFCTTGGQQKESTISSENLKASLGIPQNARVFLYLGRFVNVRGYDILIQAAKRILSSSDQDVYFVVVGESFKTPEISDKRWIQIPFTKTPGDYLNMADCCLCPNRGSLFDLSMIEILASGTPLICSKVGGYRYLDGRTHGVFYSEPENVDSLVEQINRVMKLSDEELQKCSESNHSLYDRELSLKTFWSNYSSQIDNLYRDFNIDSDRLNEPSRLPLDLDTECENILKNGFLINQSKPSTDKKKASNIKKNSSVNQINNDIKAFLVNNENNNVRTTCATPTTLTPTQRKLRKLIRNPRLYFSDFFKKHF